MKWINKLFLIASVVFHISNANAQIVLLKGTLLNTGADNVTVYLKSDAGRIGAQWVSMTICISIPDLGPGNNPTVKVTNSFGLAVNWLSEYNANAVTIGNPNPRISGGRAYYTFFGFDNGGSVLFDLFATTPFPAVEFTFDRTGIMDSEVELNDLSEGVFGLTGGGPGGNAYFYIDLQGPFGDPTFRNTDPQMFFGAPGTFANNAGASHSFVQLQSALTPVLFQEFSVIKQGNSAALLSWITSQEQNASHFIVERRITDSGPWTEIGKVKAKGNSNSPARYSFTDPNAYDGNQAVKIVFYRIRSVDLDGIEKIFPIRLLRFTATGNKEISLYPNPAKEGFYLNVPLLQSADKMVRLKMLNLQGQVINSREINSSSASNYYYDIKSAGIISGDYLLQIFLNNQLLETKKILIKY